jgi:UDP-galactopyranose mutase
MKALVIGAGLAGCVAARRLAERGHKVRLLEKCLDIGGNCRDEHREGILVHCYGAHIFHTDNADVWNFLTRFTNWRPYHHKVVAAVDDQFVPMPPNLKTAEVLCGPEAAKVLAKPCYHKKSILELRKDKDVGHFAEKIYQRLYLPYTRKQWGLWSAGIEDGVLNRVPFKASYDDCYFSNRWQALPTDGYSAMMSRMIAHPKIKLIFGADGLDERLHNWRLVIYTGPLDEFFKGKYGRLPYRSIKFDWQRSWGPFALPHPVINYPDEPSITRAIEHKRITRQVHAETIVSRETPFEWVPGEIPRMYPIPSANSIVAEYKREAESLDNIQFVGRLAEYRYYNMDEVVARAMKVTGKCESS